MKLLFVISKYYPKIGGTPNCTRNLIHHIQGEHDVQVLTTMDRMGDPKTAVCEAVPVHKVLSYAHIAMRDILHDRKMSVFSRLRACVAKTVFKLIPMEPLILRLKFRKRIRKLQKEESFDWVIAVGGDIVPARAVLGCKGPQNTCFYQLDPYTTNATLPQKGEKKRCKLEKRIHTCFDLVVTTKMIKNEMSTRFAFGENVVVCNFPNITDRTQPAQDTPEQIRCLFCGAMYAARNMDFALQVMDAVTKADSRIFFDFYILGDTAAVRQARQSNPNICLFDPVSPSEIFDVMNTHHILMNIGNVMTNQVPSKIYDYISTGLPILNFLCNEDCPTLVVFKKYSPVKSIGPWQSAEEAASQVLSFIREKAGSRESYINIEANYYENTITCVADRILANMQRLGDKEC